jgi:hypothetical protein
LGPIAQFREGIWNFTMRISSTCSDASGLEGDSDGQHAVISHRHLTSFWTENFWLAFGQQIYAFALGILYAYWREQSGSLLAPIIGHNMSDGVEYVRMFLMTWAWR